MPQSGLGIMQGKNTAKQNMFSAVCALLMKSLVNINVKFCTSRLSMKMSSFQFVCNWQCSSVYYIYHVELHFRFGHLITFPAHIFQNKSLYLYVFCSFVQGLLLFEILASCIGSCTLLIHDIVMTNARVWLSSVTLRFSNLDELCYTHIVLV